MPEIRSVMFRLADEYEPGRKMLADAISKVARREGVSLTATGAKSVSEEVLDKWLQPGSPGHEPNVKAVFCFCVAVGNFSPLGPLFDRAGLVVIPKKDLEDLEYGRVCREEKQLRERKKALEARR